MDQFVIRGGVPLRGSVQPAGNKNSALPLLAACLLTDQPVTLHNMPLIEDVQTMRQLVQAAGATVELLGPSSWRIQAAQVSGAQLDPELCSAVRASILLAGPLLARCGELHLFAPGGDVIGRRRLDTHLLALRALGAQIDWRESFHMHTKGLQGAAILLDEASVTATENAVMAAVLARGNSVLRNVASEPHVQELCRFLNQMGARIRGIGSNVLEIEGVARLQGGEHTVEPDYLEVVSFAGAAAVTGGEVRIVGAAQCPLEMAAVVFGRLGVHWQTEGADLLVAANQALRITQDFGGAIPKVDDAPWPGFPADLMSVAILVATQCTGTVLFHEKMFESRLYFVDKLVSMGARIIVCDPHRCVVQGPGRLRGERLESPDIRAGMALLLAALCAQGESLIRNIGQIERGYERVDEKLRALGADIVRAPA